MLVVPIDAAMGWNGMGREQEYDASFFAPISGLIPLSILYSVEQSRYKSNAIVGCRSDQNRSIGICIEKISNEQTF